MKRGIISIMFAMFVLCLWSVPAKATPVTTTYEFVKDESTVVRTSWVSNPRTYYIDGQFQMIIDYDVGIASFNRVNAKLSSEIEFYDYYKKEIIFTDDLNVLFNMTELVSTSVTQTKIDFLFEKNIPRFPASDVYLTVKFFDDSLQMTGYFGEPVADGYWYSLDATAVVVPEPLTLLLFGLGSLVVVKRR